MGYVLKKKMWERKKGEGLGLPTPRQAPDDDDRRNGFV
jgi:hypothetical protein